MATIVIILIFIIRTNDVVYCLLFRVRNWLICWYFDIYEHYQILGSCELIMEKFYNSGPDLEVIKKFMLNSTEHEISTAHKN